MDDAVTPPPAARDATSDEIVAGGSIARFLHDAVMIFMRPYGGQYLLIILSVFVTVAFGVGLNLSFTPLIDEVLPNHDVHKLALIFGGLAIAFVLSSAGQILQDYLGARIGMQVLNDLRLRLFRHLQDLPASFYTRTPSGDIVSRFVNDLNGLENALTQALPNALLGVMWLVINAAILFWLDWQLALLMLLILPLTLILPKRFTQRATQASYQRKQNEAALASFVQENVEANALIRAFGLQRSTIAAFSKESIRFAPSFLSANFFTRLVSRTADIGEWFMYLLVMAAGAYQIFRGAMSVGMFVSFVEILSEVTVAVTVISGVLRELISATAGHQRIQELLDERPTIIEASPPVELLPLARDLTFDQVTFSYADPDSQPVLHGTNFSIPAKQSVAFVGLSGSGKSTVLNLVMRFYDPNQGRVQMDGQDLRQVSQASLHAQMGVVLQDTFLFNTTVRENIRLSKPDATDVEVETAAREAEIHEPILALPQGYDTPVGERGSKLSGGQRQRIALARALLRKPAILLLDEATSALDPATEAAINATLKKLAARHDRTILSVTHRLASVVSMDQIVVLDQGAVVEQGSHQELLQRQGLYCHLWQQQSGFLVSPDGQYAEVTPARLRSIPLFETLDDATLEKFAAQFATAWYDAGRTVIQEGEWGDRFYIIVRGKVSVTTLGPNQQPVQIRHWQDGDYFGEIALLEGGRRTATVRTILPSLFLTLERQNFSNMVASFPDVREAVEQAARLRRIDLNLWKNT
jgi:ATP-binding cassette, subfamily B, bacterial